MLLNCRGEPGIEPRIDALLEEVQAFMAAQPDSRKVLGPLVGRMRSVRTVAPKKALLDWVPVLEGHMALGHRPRNKGLAVMRYEGTTHLVTLLSATEGAEDIGRRAKQAGLTWIWLPMSSAEPPDEDQLPAMRAAFDEMQSVLVSGGRIYLHCSAGIHRTGMMGYALLRHVGLTPDEAMNRLRALRVVTAEGVGQERLDWGDQFARNLPH